MDNKLLKIIEENDVEAIFITNKYDITYVNKFTGEESYVLITKTNRYIIVDHRYIEQAKKQCYGFDVVLYENIQIDLMSILKRLMKLNDVKKLGVDIHDIKHKLYQDIKNELAGVNIVNLEEPFKESRTIKSPEEIRKIQIASEITDKSYYRMLQMISEGMSEKDIEIELEYSIKREGGDGYAFEPVIGAGSKTSMPYSWADKNVYLKKGDILVLNYGAKYEGYTTAISRMVAIGNIKEEYKNMYKNAFEVQNILLNAVKPFMKYEELYDIYTESIKNLEYKDYFLKSIGHGRGLQTIEGYIIKPNIKRIIYPNEVYSIGVSVSVPDLGGARLEDAVLIKDDSAVIMTNSVRNLLNI